MQIETELIEKLNHSSTLLIVEDEDLPESELYTKTDIYDVCSKLYSDELLSVFNVCNETVTDTALTKMSTNMGLLWELLKQNENIFNLVKHIKDDGFGEHNITLQNTFNFLFTYDIFYHFHLCIRDFIENGDGIITDEYMAELNLIVDNKLLKTT